MADLEYYKILQVDPEADEVVIVAAFRALARKLHPDRDISGVDAIRMADLNRAYAVLRDPAKRRAYDQQRTAPIPVGPGPRSAAAGAHAATTSRSTTPLDRFASRHSEPDSAEQVRLDFGRYAGYTLREIARADVDYLRWLSRHSAGIRYRRAIAKILGDTANDPYASRASR